MKIKKQINIAPNDDILVIEKNKEEYTLKNFSWGIKFPGDKTPLIFNSRIETIIDKPFWRNLFEKNRCLIPATAFYEWETIEKNKIPQKISFTNMPLFFIGGIYISIKDEIFASMLTTTPNTTIAKIHNRMPVILNMEEGLKFLSIEGKEAISMCIPIDDNISAEIKTASDILTDKQKEFLSSRK